MAERRNEPRLTGGPEGLDDRSTQNQPRLDVGDDEVAAGSERSRELHHRWAEGRQMREGQSARHDVHRMVGDGQFIDLAEEKVRGGQATAVTGPPSQQGLTLDAEEIRQRVLIDHGPNLNAPRSTNHRFVAHQGMPSGH